LQGENRNIFYAKPIEELITAQKTIVEQATAGKITIAVIGSGPSAIEIAGNIHQLCTQQATHMPDIQVFGGKNFMSGRPKRVQSLARKILEAKGIKMMDAGYVRKIEDNRIITETGNEYPADIIFPALGVRPSQIFARSKLPVGTDGGLHVNEYLQSVGYDNIFGGGDCIFFAPEPLDKVGVYAVRENPVLYHNLMACLEGKPLEKFTPGGKYLLIYNLGDGDGVFSKWSFTFSGKLAFTIKDRIDRRFIRTFQEE
jgi:NADH dehydrogenase FAD-containing subunit